MQVLHTSSLGSPALHICLSFYLGILVEIFIFCYGFTTCISICSPVSFLHGQLLNTSQMRSQSCYSTAKIMKFLLSLEVHNKYIVIKVSEEL